MRCARMWRTEEAVEALRRKTRPTTTDPQTLAPFRPLTPRAQAMSPLSAPGLAPLSPEWTTRAMPQVAATSRLFRWGASARWWSGTASLGPQGSGAATLVASTGRSASSNCMPTPSPACWPMRGAPAVRTRAFQDGQTVLTLSSACNELRRRQFQHAALLCP